MDDSGTALDRALSLRSSSAMIGLTSLATAAAVLEQHVQDGDLAAARSALRRGRDLDRAGPAGGHRLRRRPGVSVPGSRDDRPPAPRPPAAGRPRHGCCWSAAAPRWPARRSAARPGAAPASRPASWRRRPTSPRRRHAHKLSVVFTWTASASTYTDGYELRFTANGTAHVLTVSRDGPPPRRATPCPRGVTYVFTLASTVTVELEQHHEPDVPAIRC